MYLPAVNLNLLKNSTLQPLENSTMLPQNSITDVTIIQTSATEYNVQQIPDVSEAISPST